MKRFFDEVECNDRYPYDNMFNIIRFVFGLMYKKKHNLCHCTRGFLMIIWIKAAKYCKKTDSLILTGIFFIVISKCLTTQLYQLQNRLLFLKQ